MRKVHAYSPRTTTVTRVLGAEITRARVARRWSQEDLAERAGVSVKTLRSVEQGAPTVAIGIVFEVAALVGLELLDTPDRDLPARLANTRDRVALLPSRVRSRATDAVDDNF